MQYATCINESVYQGALTYGRKYAILAIKDDPARPTVKIQGDNGRTRWFPAVCFDLTGADVPRIQTIRIRDDLAHAATSAIEVEMTLSDGQQRWCFFAIPPALTQFGDWIAGTTVHIHYGVSHMIIVERIDVQIIEQALRYIESQGKLFTSTRLFAPD